MQFARAIGMIFLMFALLANGVAVGALATAMATEAPTAAHRDAALAASAHGDCHQQSVPSDAGDAVPQRPGPQDCCDAAGCTCACIHYTSAAFTVIVFPAASGMGAAPQRGRLGPVANAPLQPRLRPPIV